jgi:iron(III) transport system substrate-binding protein
MKSTMVKGSRWLAFLFLCVVMITVTACGGSADKPTEKQSAEAPKSGEKQKLVIYTARDKNVVEEIIPKFKEKNPGIEVEVLNRIL